MPVKPQRTIMALAVCFVFAWIAAFTPACVHDPATLGLPFLPGDVIYPQVNFRTEARGKVYLTYSTNHIGLPELIPLGTRVTVRDVGASWLRADVAGKGLPWTIEFQPKHNRTTFAAWLARNFAKAPPTLPDALTPAERENIRQGTFAVGMSRAALRLALGDPPASLTPDPGARTLLYEKKRFNRIAFTFGDDGRVVNVKD